MSDTERGRRLSYEEQEAIVFADRERRARKKPWWYLLALSALPHVCHTADQLRKEWYRHEAINGGNTTNVEKWTAIEAHLRQIMAEEMVALDALQEHVDLFTYGDRVTIAQLLEGANTEEERLDVVLGSPMLVLLREAEAKSPQQAEDSGYDTEDTLSFIVELDEELVGESKSARKRRHQKENRRRRAAAEATNQTESEQPAAITEQDQDDKPAPESVTLDFNGESKNARKRRRLRENRRKRAAAEAANQSDGEQGAAKTGQNQDDEPAPESVPESVSVESNGRSKRTQRRRRMRKNQRTQAAAEAAEADQGDGEQEASKTGQGQDGEPVSE
ncbi:hypothetical protein H2200_012502 [Cladophialophora chaetospira]|uniref:Uncharacterized protein n=1 Tax=Cladophialophora chaetospira TaxID=386627 RepID=A0AA38WY19_9EURO|nr:hypothetical protein H2200_012502 [Cladophialophora chaetospira]